MSRPEIQQQQMVESELFAEEKIMTGEEVIAGFNNETRDCGESGEHFKELLNEIRGKLNSIESQVERKLLQKATLSLNIKLLYNQRDSLSSIGKEIFDTIREAAYSPTFNDIREQYREYLITNRVGRGDTFEHLERFIVIPEELKTPDRDYDQRIVEYLKSTDLAYLKKILTMPLYEFPAILDGLDREKLNQVEELLASSNDKVAKSVFNQNVSVIDKAEKLRYLRAQKFNRVTPEITQKAEQQKETALLKQIQDSIVRKTAQKLRAEVNTLKAILKQYGNGDTSTRPAIIEELRYFLSEHQIDLQDLESDLNNLKTLMEGTPHVESATKI